jgi:hypothetical protein
MAEEDGIPKIYQLSDFSAFSQSSLLGLDLFLRTMETRDDFPLDFRNRVSGYTSWMMDLAKSLSDITEKNPKKLHDTEGKQLLKNLHAMGGYVKKLIDDLKYYREQRADTWDDDLNLEIKKLEYTMPYIEGMMGLSYEMYKVPVPERRPLISPPSMKMPEVKMPAMEMPKIKAPKLKMPAVKSDAIVVVVLVVIASMGGLILMEQMQPATGFSILPTGDIAGVSYEMLYIMISAVIIGIIAGAELGKKF